MKFLKWYITNDVFLIIFGMILTMVDIIAAAILGSKVSCWFFFLFCLLPVTIMPIIYLFYREEHK
jgi:hypothetical protein